MKNIKMLETGFIPKVQKSTFCKNKNYTNTVIQTEQGLQTKVVRFHEFLYSTPFERILKI